MCMVLKIDDDHHLFLSVASCYITLVLVVKCTHSIASLYIQNVFCYSSDMLFITNLLQNAGFFTKKLKCLKHHQMINYCIERK